MKAFNVAKGNLRKLRLFVPIVARVHGGNHPEFHDVRKLYNEINSKIKKAGSEKPKLDKEFKQLREITDNYTIPGDVCKSYEGVYNMISEIDEAYQAILN